MTQPLYQQWSSTSRSTTVFSFILYYSAVLCKHHIYKREKGTPHDCVFFYEIQTMFPQLANQPSRVLPADTCMLTDHVLMETKINGFEKKTKKGKLKVAQFLYYINFLVIHKVIDFMWLFRHGLHFLWNNFLCRVWNMQYITVKATKELSCGELFVASVRKVTCKGAMSQIYQNSGSRNCHQFEWIIKITTQNIKRRYK